MGDSMADRQDRGVSGSTGEHDRAGVFRRGGNPNKPDEFEKLYRSRESEQRIVGEARRLPPADEAPPRRPKRRERRTHSRGQVYDGRGIKRRAQERRNRRIKTTVVVVLALLMIIPGGFYLWADSRLERLDALQDYEDGIGRSNLPRKALHRLGARAFQVEVVHRQIVDLYEPRIHAILDQPDQGLRKLTIDRLAAIAAHDDGQFQFVHWLSFPLRFNRRDLGRSGLQLGQAQGTWA